MIVQIPGGRQIHGLGIATTALLPKTTKKVDFFTNPILATMSTKIGQVHPYKSSPHNYMEIGDVYQKAEWR